MTASLTPSPKQYFFDNSGNPLVGGKLYTYIAGTNTPIVTYKSSSGVTENTNPILLDARGECDIWLNPSVAYKFKLCDSNGVEIWNVDNITTVAGGSGGTVDWSSITNKPSTYPPSAHNQVWTTIQSTPTTINGYGITDSYTKIEVNNLIDGVNDSIDLINSNVNAISASIDNIQNEIDVIDNSILSLDSKVTTLSAESYKIKLNASDNNPGYFNNKIVWGSGLVATTTSAYVTTVSAESITLSAFPNGISVSGTASLPGGSFTSGGINLTAQVNGLSGISFTENGTALSAKYMLKTDAFGFNFTQSSPSTSWVVNHNLGYRPVVQTWNSAYDEIKGSVNHTSINSLTITFSNSENGGGRCV